MNLSRRRLAVALLSALALSLAFAGNASAKKVYDYVYSGQYIDGTGSEKGTFPVGFENPLAGVAYDADREKVLALVGSYSGVEPPPSYVSKFTKAGLPDPFSPPEIGDTLVLSHRVGESSQIVVDNTDGPENGNFYIASLGFGGSAGIYGFKSTGAPLPGFERSREGLCGIAVGPQSEVWVGARFALEAYNAAGEKMRSIPVNEGEPKYCNPAVDSDGNIYVQKVVNFSNGKAVKLSPSGDYLYDLSQNENVNGIAVDPSTNDVFVSEGAVISQYDSNGVKLNVFGAPDPGHSFAGLTGVQGIAIDPLSHDVWVGNEREYPGGVRHVERFVRTPATITVPTVTTGAVDLAPTSAGLHGMINADGVTTTDCHFDWGTTPGLGSSVPCAEGNVFEGSGDHAVSAALPALTKGQTYYYRLSAKNGNERVSPGVTAKFLAQGKPLASTFADGVNTDGVELRSEIDPNGGRTTYYFEWGSTESYGTSSPVFRLVEFVKSGQYEQAKEVDDLVNPQVVSHVVTGLIPGTVYHYRVVVKNEAGTTVGEDRTITTYVPDPGTDPCPNAQVRKQTEAGLLLNCRAYELVSAPNAGGYDVESDLIPGQEPFEAYPSAADRLLYGLNFGSVPGIEGSPTNFGLDPYVATRDANGWSTKYVGLPSDGMAEKSAFGSPLLEADSSLAAFAFGGLDICDPCFEDGSTNIPMRFADGSLGKGMAGSRSPAGNPVGYVAKRFSADGNHFLFSSNSRFENVAKNGELTLYDRDLSVGTTQVISTNPDGSLMGTADKPAILDVSSDGSRIVIAKTVSEEVGKDTYFHPYMHLGGDPETIDLAPTSTTGVLHAGMSADGSRVFFNSTEQLNGEDLDESADLYEAAVNGAGSLSLELLSAGTTLPVGNVDGCDPVSNANGENWNALGVTSTENCGILAIAGGGGVARDEGSVYFLSPETLDGEGVANQPNLFLVRPGEAPKFVLTLEASSPAVLNALADPQAHRYGDFQVTPDGAYAAFNSKAAPEGVVSFGHTLIYRYDSEGDAVQCISCTPTGAAITSDAFLAPYGLSLADDGRLFFSSAQPYVLRDTNEKKDAYEWEDGVVQLISTGSSPDDSTVLSVSSDAKDVFFFTRQTLAHGDDNGSAVKVYDARQGGGFLFDPPPFPCAASDECHGPGTQAPSAPRISTVTGSGRPSAPKAQAKPTKCRRSFVKKRGKCVKRMPKRSPKSKRGNGR